MRIRLIVAFVLVVLVSVVSVVLAVRMGAAREVGRFMFGGGMWGGDELASELEAYYGENGSWQGVQDLFLRIGHGFGPGGQGRGQGMGSMMGDMMNQRLRLADSQGNLIVDTASSSTGKLSATELAQGIQLSSGGKVVGYLLPEGGVPFTQGDESRLVNRLNQAGLTAGLIGGGLSLLLGFLLAYTLLRPVRELTRASQRLAGGDLGHRVTVHGDDELALLGKSFNQMASSLEQAEQSRRALTADIAHELRTPLAVQRAHLEALQDKVYPLSIENLEPVLAQNYLLTRLVEDLGTLAVAEAGQLNLEKQLTDFPMLVQRVADRFRPQCESREITLRTEGAKANIPRISIDPARIEQILGNILSNALRYTPEGGSIELTLTSTASHVFLEVHDSGPGIPAEALERVFERFYRVDASRSREGGGSGLGLSIARQLAQAHGGDLVATNHPQGGAVFTLKFPV